MYSGRLPRARVTAIVSICLAMACWPIVEALPRFMSQSYSPIQIVWTRYATHLLLMLVWWIPRRRGADFLVRTQRPLLQALRSVTMVGMPACFVVASIFMPLTAVMSVFWIVPLLVIGLAIGTLGERVTGWQGLAAGAAYVGTLLVLSPPSDGVVRWTSIWPLLMAGCFALYQILTRMLRHETTSSRLFYTALGVWLPLTFALPWSWKSPRPRDLALMATIGVLGLVFLWGLDRALDAAPASQLAPFVLAQPIWVVVLEAVLHRTLPGGATIGGIIVVFAAWLIFLWARNEGSSCPCPARREPEGVDRTRLRC
jgi:drug/metabolite transporter (DMT)-like permease